MCMRNVTNRVGVMDECVSSVVIALTLRGLAVDFDDAVCR
jgi:hypothetical protein